jgi:hypothetical protein
MLYRILGAIVAIVIVVIAYGCAERRNSDSGDSAALTEAQ